MAKKKSAAETLQGVKERGSEKDIEIINNDPVVTTRDNNDLMEELQTAED
jgi:hypothetical protein